MNSWIVLGLVNNAALLLALVMVYDMVAFVFQERKNRLQQVFTGIILGAIGVAIMLNPWNFGQGVVFDTRSVLLGISGFFFGTIPVVLAVSITAAFRLLVGGTGAWTGVSVIATSGAIGLAWRHLRRNVQPNPSLGEIYLLGLAIHVAMLACMFTLPLKMAIDVLSKISLPVMLIYPATTAVLGTLLINREKRKQSENALRASEEKYRTMALYLNKIFDALPIGLWFADKNGKLLRGNTAGVKIWGAEPTVSMEEYGVFKARRLPSGEEIAADDWALAHTVREGITVENELLEIDAFDGQKKRILNYTTPVLDDSGQMLGAMVMNIDVTERMRMEEAQQKLQQRLSQAVELAHLGYWEYDVDKNQFIFDDAFYRIFHTTADRVGGYILSSKEYAERFVYPDDRWQVADEVRKAIETTDPAYHRQLEHRIRYADGTIGHMAVRFFVRKDDQGKTIKTFGINQDITERKQAEQSMIESEHKWRNILVNTPQIGISLDPQAGIIFANAHFLTLTGWTEQEILGQNWFDLFIPEAIREQIRQVFHAVMTNKDTLGFVSFENDILTKTGEIRNIAWSNVLTKDARGEAVDVTCLGVDLTERNRAEEERAKLQAQLHQAQKMESVGRLAGGVAHDFNNMLGVILGHAELALEKVKPGEPLHADLQEINTAALRSADLTRQLLAFARKQVISPKEIDLNDTIEGMLRMLRRLIGEDIDLVWRPGHRLWPVRMDPSQIDQILANLCVNARDAIGGVGRIAIETRNAHLDDDACVDRMGCPGDFVLLSISDTGHGMDKETLDHIFEPFFTTKDVGEGTGLGLATVYGIIDQNQGFIEVSSLPGQGTTFRLHLPRCMDKTVQVREKEEKQLVIRGNETILLVEDEPAILKMTQMMLARQGYTVLTATGPDRAIDLAKEHEGGIHLLMTDVVMPEMSGYDLAEQLKVLYPGLKSLFMSGYTADVIAHRGILDVGVHFLQKPFSLRDLAVRVREALESITN